MLNVAPNSARDRALAGLFAGLIGGLVFGLLVGFPFGLGIGLIFSVGLGTIFGLVCGPNIRTVGAGLVWGQAYGIFWWLFGSLTLFPLLSEHSLAWTITSIQEIFPHLLGQVIGYGAVLGLAYYGLLWQMRRLSLSKAEAPPLVNAKPLTEQVIVPPLIQAIIIGGLGGLAGSWVFARGMETAEFYPLVAELMGSDSMGLGQLLHYLIGTTIGVSFGILFYRDVQGVGSSLVWGVNYGLLWWIIGPLTLLPWFLGVRFDWSLAAAQAAFPSLVAHLLYGGLVGLTYAVCNKIWHILFIDSDPLNRPLEGSGVRGTRSLLMGQVGGIAGGLLFTFVMVRIDALPQVAGLIGAQSEIIGFVLHLLIAIFIGGSYGLLFQREAYSPGSGMAWGLVYGLVWWLLGAVTLFPVILRQPVDWSLIGVLALYPSLVGHLLYGAGLGLFFQLLALRYDDELTGRPRRGTQGARLAAQAHRQPQRRAAGTPASALWAVVLILCILLPLLFSSNTVITDGLY